MALADLDLSIEACIVNSCTGIEITDSTGVYHATTNTGGWQNAATILAADVTSATITITLPSGEEMDVVDVLSEIPDPVTGEFTFEVIDLDTAEDGEYTIKYKIGTSAGTKTKTITIYSLCNSRCCIDKIWSKYAQGLDTDKECGCTKTSSSHSDNALLGETLLKAITSSAMCNNTTARDKLLKKLQRLCNLQKCNCNNKS